MTETFTCKPTPALVFGPGRLNDLPGLLKPYGTRLLLLTGGRSFLNSGNWSELQQRLAVSGYSVSMAAISGEPSPQEIDHICSCHRPEEIDAVVAIGGGSVLDGGKAVAAMLVEQQPVHQFLEGVGSSQPSGLRKPFIAIPTTSGTGSEATSNAVLSQVGPAGFKKSLRHDCYIADIALLDPALTISCPPPLTAACGMDAFSQLLEAYLSTKGSPYTDMLALEGIRRVNRSLVRCFTNGEDLAARTDLCYAAYLSGIVLANAGLGAVHGLASPLGGLFAIPHGVVCGTLMGPANRITLDALRTTTGNPQALSKYSQLGKLVTGNERLSGEEAQDAFISYLENLCETLCIPPLSAFSVSPDDIARIVSQADSKNNPVPLSNDELALILRTRITPEEP